MEAKKLSSDTSTTNNVLPFKRSRTKPDETNSTDSLGRYSLTNDTYLDNFTSILMNYAKDHISDTSRKAFIDFSSKDEYSENNRNTNISNNSIGDDTMDNNKLLETYINKVDRDQSDLRNDIRSSEDRTSKNIELSEQKNSDRLDRIENMISDSINKMDERYNKLETRIDNSYNRLEDKLNDNHKSLEASFSTAEQKIDNNNKYIISIAVTTILSIAAMVVTIILTVE